MNGLFVLVIGKSITVTGMSRYGKVRRIAKTYIIPVGIGLGMCYGVVQLVGTPSQNYRRLQVCSIINKTPLFEINRFA